MEDSLTRNDAETALNLTNTATQTTTTAATADSLGNDYSVFEDRSIIIEDSLIRAIDEDEYDTISVNFQTEDTLNLTMGSGSSTGTETDPIFTASAAAQISSTDIAKWNNSGVYTNLTGKPQINNTTLTGNQTSSDLGLQAELVSGTNIKTINSQSILGSGNITIDTGVGSYEDLTDKPKINSIELDGNKSLSDLGIINFSGSYEDLTNKPTIPSKTSDLTNDSGYITNSYHDSTKVDVVSGKSLIDNTKITKLDGIEAEANKTIINNTVTSTATDEALSANMGKELQDEIDNLKSRGRFLALWDASTGLAESDPTTSPYTYKTGDYYVIGTIDSTTNYKPTGSTYTIGIASTVVELNTIAIDDVYYYDGENWRLQQNAQRSVTFASIAGQPSDNTNLASALNAKQDTLVSGTNIKTINNNSILGTGDITIDISGKEDTTNKTDSYNTSSVTTYPNSKALFDGLATKQDVLSSTNAGNNITITQEGGSSGVLPSGYIQLEFIRSTGTQGIDLGTLTEGSVEVDFSPTRLTGSASGSYDGVLGQNSAPQLGWYTSGWTVGNAGSATPYPPEVGTKYTYKYVQSTGKVYIDGEDTGLVRAGTLKLTLCYTEQSYKPCKIYEFRQYDVNGNLIKRLIPCSYNSEIGMYDITNSIFYTNTGTGTFYAGSIIGAIVKIAATVPTKTSDLTNDSGFVDNTYHDTSKQDSLVSGTNIKTINGQNILGSGDVTIQSGGAADDITTRLNSDNETEVIGIYTTDDEARKIWEGTKAEYDAIVTKDSDTYYYITDDGLFSYNDLADKPTIPTVNNGTLTIQKNGTNIQTFTANQSTNATANIIVPTKTSELTNDSSFITSSYHDSTKQDTLVSGTSIKTINSQSLLGSGDIAITGGSEIDNASITENSNDEIQTVGVIDQMTGNANKEWTGTLAQYNAISSKDSNTLYYITDDTISYNDLTDKPTIPQGTVTSITAGTGLSGGTITASGTIALNAAASSTLGGLKVRYDSTTGSLYIRNDGSDA